MENKENTLYERVKEWSDRKKFDFQTKQLATAMQILEYANRVMQGISSVDNDGHPLPDVIADVSELNLKLSMFLQKIKPEKENKMEVYFFVALVQNEYCYEKKEMENSCLFLAETTLGNSTNKHWKFVKQEGHAFVFKTMEEAESAIKKYGFFEREAKYFEIRKIYRRY